MEQLLTYVVLGLMSLAQIIQLAMGKSENALKTQKKKEKIIAKLEKKHQATEQKFINEEEQINKLKGV